MDDRFSVKAAIQKIVPISALLSLYVWICLAVADQMLADSTTIYPISEDYLVPVGIFFIALSVATYVTHRRRWPARVTFLFLPIALFFPLVFFGVVVEALVLGGTEQASDIALRYCDVEELIACGAGFRNLIMLRSLRAMAAVLTVPPLCYVMHVHWFKTNLLTPTSEPPLAASHPNLASVKPVQASTRLVDNVIEGASKDAIFYWNLLVLNTVSLYTSLMSVRAGLIYATIGTGVIALGFVVKRSAKGKTLRDRKIRTDLGILLGEITLIAGLVVGINASPGADAPTASLIVIIVSFLAMPLSANRLHVFLLSRTLLFLTSASALYFMHTSIATGPESFPEHLAPLLILMLINFVVGALLCRNNSRQVSLQLSVESLQRDTAQQNRELETILATLSREEQKNREQYQFRERLFRFMGHDLRQPINALSFLLFRLEKEEDDPERLNRLKLARESIGSTNQMIDDVLELSTERKLDMEHDLEPLAVQDLFEVIESEYAELFNAADIELRVIPTSTLILSDRESVLRSLRNLMSNVRKYAPKGACVLGVRRRRHFVDLQVIDQGPGIHQDHLETIFHPFERLNGGAPRAGFGLGLAIVKELTGSANGSVLVTSNQGRGTSFTLRFPKAD